MSLFTVNRYDGDNVPLVSNNANDDQEESKKKLQKILKKAEKRKHAREKQKLAKAFPPSKKKKHLVANDDNEVILKEKIIDESTGVVEKDDNENENILQSEKHEDFPFQVIGTDKFTKKSKVKRVLPHWLTNPVKVSADLKNLHLKIKDLSIVDKKIQKILRQNGHEYYFPIQEAILPYFIQENYKPNPFWPRDICISAATGSGKTLAFVLPIIQLLKDRVVRKIRALVVLPVKELAQQVFDVCKQFVNVSDLKVTLLTGTVPFNVEQKKLVRKVGDNEYVFETDIVVTTPGRLVDHLYQTEGLTFKNLKFLVLDEADRMLDREQNDWIYHFEEHLKRENVNFRIGKINLKNFQNSQRPPQKILASATLTHDPEKLYRIGLFKPKLFTSVNTDDREEQQLQEYDDENIDNFVIPGELEQNYVMCSTELKPLILYHLIKSRKMKRVLCFTGSGLETHRLATLLRILSDNKITVAELSSSLKEKTRNVTLKQFADGDVDILVSTDALARGLDIANVEYVISYNAPKYIQTYVHRIGRTGRAGKAGISVTLVNYVQKQHFFKLFKKCPKNQLNEILLNEEKLNSMNVKYQEGLAKMAEIFENESKNQLDKRKKIKGKLTKKKN